MGLLLKFGAGIMKILYILWDQVVTHGDPFSDGKYLNASGVTAHTPSYLILIKKICYYKIGNLFYFQKMYSLLWFWGCFPVEKVVAVRYVETDGWNFDENFTFQVTPVWRDVRRLRLIFSAAYNCFEKTKDVSFQKCIYV